VEVLAVKSKITLSKIFLLTTALYLELFLLWRRKRQQTKIFLQPSSPPKERRFRGEGVARKETANTIANSYLNPYSFQEQGAANLAAKLQLVPSP